MKEIGMKGMIRPILLSLIPSILFFAAVLSPVAILGCRTRGLLAFLITLGSGGAAGCTAAIGLIKRIRGGSDSIRWMVFTLVLTLPVIGILILA
jgi:hypothetical protein